MSSFQHLIPDRLATVTSLATKYWQIMLAQGVVVGIGAGMNFIASVTVVGTYFSTKRSTAQGLAATGSCFGGIIYPIVLKQLLADGMSLAWSTRIVAFLMLGTLLISAAVMRPRSDLPPRKSGPLVDFDSLESPPFAIWLIGCFLTFIGLYIPFFYVEVDALSLGVSDNMSFYMLTIMNAASVPGRVFPAYLADKLGNLHIIIPAVLLSGIVALAWIAVTDGGSLLALSVLFGLANGAINSVVPGTVAFLCPDLRKLGSNIGMTLFASGLGMLVGSPVAGAILGRDDRFWAAFLFTGVVVIVGGLLICVCRVLKVGFAMTKA
jgi:MFS family permease